MTNYGIRGQAVLRLTNPSRYVVLQLRMLRTTFYFPEPFYQRLRMASQRHGKSASKLAQEWIERALSREEEQHLEALYQSLDQLDGFIHDPITDASTTIDAVLYGEPRTGERKIQHTQP